MARRPAAFAIKPTSVVTVLLPLVPVMAAIGAFASRTNNSMSPMIGMPRAAALMRNGSRNETPGDAMTCDAPSSKDSSNAPKRTSTSGANCSSAADSGGDGLLSVTAKLEAARLQITRARQSRPAQADDDRSPPLLTIQRANIGASGEDRAASCDQRTFNVASPISTRITEMIQKRTITFGSAQPLSSK